MTTLLSVETIFFTLLGYPISYLEFVGTILYLWSVWLIAKRNILTWPVGILSVLLFMMLFFQIRLYSAALEQVYYLGACSAGWWFWSRSKLKHRTIQAVSFGGHRIVLFWIAVTAVLAGCLGAAMTKVHLWLPSLFPEAAAFPHLDALTTVMSFVAMGLMVQRRIESWIYWIVVDVISIWLYFVKGIPFLSLLYVLLLALAISGLIRWIKTRSPPQSSELHSAETGGQPFPKRASPST
jgi:nicotinamide mononucleotide transporter